MSKTWIDERPFEEIIRSSIVDHQYDAQLEDILLRVEIDAQFNYKLYKSNNQSTLFDVDILLDSHKVSSIKKEFKREEEKFEGLCKSYDALSEFDNEKTNDKNNYKEEEEEEEEEEDNNVDDHVAGQKDFIAGKKNKGNGNKEQQKMKDILKQIQKLKTDMANSQDKLMKFQKEITALEHRIQYLTHYQYADKVYFQMMKELIRLFEKNKDKEFLKQGIYHIVKYNDMMRRRYVSKEMCYCKDNLCSVHYLPFEDGKETCVLYKN